MNDTADPRIRDRSAIRPFRVDVSDAELTELRKRIDATRLAKGGHFAAREQPEFLVDEVRKGLKSLRT